MNVGVKKYQQISRGDQEKINGRLREELILEYAPLVKEIAERIAIRLPPNISKDELISGGIMGLFDALDKFDPEKGIKFRTYAQSRIKGAILDELRRMDWVPRSVRRDIHRIERAIRSLGLKLNREPTDLEVAEEMGVDVESYHRITVRAQGAGLLSLDEYMTDGFTHHISKKASEAPSPYDDLKIKEVKNVLSKTLSKLTEKEQLIMSLYYYDELTLKEIAKVLDLTESRICQIHSKVLIKLRVKLKTYYEN